MIEGIIGLLVFIIVILLYVRYEPWIEILRTKKGLLICFYYNSYKCKPKIIRVYKYINL